MLIRSALGAAFLSLAVASTARANMLVNGGLEKSAGAAVNQYNLINLAPGSTSLPGWTITSGTVDLVPGAATGNQYWQNTEGSYSLDLVGTPGIGAISQQVTTVKNTDYTLSFDFSINPEVGPLLETGTTKILRIQAVATGGAILASQTYSDVVGTRTRADMQWSPKTFSFTATGTTVVLRIAALTPLNLPAGATSSNIFTGPVIDNLDLEPGGGGNPTPEPASLGLLGAGATALLLRRRRKTA